MSLSDLMFTLFRSFGFITPKTLNYLAFQSFDFELTWWRLLQKGVVRILFDIYVLIAEILIKQQLNNQIP